MDSRLLAAGVVLLPPGNAVQELRRFALSSAEKVAKDAARKPRHSGGRYEPQRFARGGAGARGTLLTSVQPPPQYAHFFPGEGEEGGGGSQHSLRSLLNLVGGGAGRSPFAQQPTPSRAAEAGLVRDAVQERGAEEGKNNLLAGAIWDTAPPAAVAEVAAAAEGAAEAAEAEEAAAAAEAAEAETAAAAAVAAAEAAVAAEAVAAAATAAAAGSAASASARAAAASAAAAQAEAVAAAAAAAAAFASETAANPNPFAPYMYDTVATALGMKSLLAAAAAPVAPKAATTALPSIRISPSSRTTSSSPSSPPTSAPTPPKFPSLDTDVSTFRLIKRATSKALASVFELATFDATTRARFAASEARKRALLQELVVSPPRPPVQPGQLEPAQLPAVEGGCERAARMERLRARPRGSPSAILLLAATTPFLHHVLPPLRLAEVGLESGVPEEGLTEAQMMALQDVGVKGQAHAVKRAEVAAPLFATEAQADAAAHAALYKGVAVWAATRPVAARMHSARALAIALRVAAREDLPAVAPRVTGAATEAFSFSLALPPRVLADCSALAAGAPAVSQAELAKTIAAFHATAEALHRNVTSRRNLMVVEEAAAEAAAVAAAKRGGRRNA